VGAGYALGMETEHNPTEERPEEGTAALDDDNPPPPDDAGQKGAGAATGGDEGLTEGSEPGEGDDIRDAERP
jgi:hypothetical protein